MIVDVLLVAIFIIAIITGRKTGLFGAVARLVSLALAAVFTALWGEPLRTWLSETALYKSGIEKLTEVVQNAVNAGETALVEPFLQEANMVAELAAKGILDTLVTGICFVIFSLITRILIEVLDKLFLHLPLVRPLNQILGMVFSFVFTVIVSYLVIGLLGGFAMCSDAALIKEQMESSVLVRGMYENNIILNLFLRKG